MAAEVLKQWLDKANADFRAAEILIEADPLILDIACFHLHQAVEKFLKSFLVANNLQVHFTHDLEFLGQQCGIEDAVFNDLDFGRLTMFAVRARYPHDYDSPSADEVRGYVVLAEYIREIIYNRTSGIL